MAGLCLREAEELSFPASLDKDLLLHIKRNQMGSSSISWPLCGGFLSIYLWEESLGPSMVSLEGIDIPFALAMPWDPSHLVRVCC